MPKAEATGLAPLRIGAIRTLERPVRGFLILTWPHPGGEVLEPRPWASKGEDRRAAIARRSCLRCWLQLIPTRRWCESDRSRLLSTLASQADGRFHPDLVARRGSAPAALCGGGPAQAKVPLLSVAAG